MQNGRESSLGSALAPEYAGAYAIDSADLLTEHGGECNDLDYLSSYSYASHSQQNNEQSSTAVYCPRNSVML